MCVGELTKRRDRRSGWEFDFPQLPGSGRYLHIFSADVSAPRSLNFSGKCMHRFHTGALSQRTVLRHTPVAHFGCLSELQACVVCSRLIDAEPFLDSDDLFVHARHQLPNSPYSIPPYTSSIVPMLHCAFALCIATISL